jgi:NADH-quinone oxidoreductase subunit L
MDLAFLNDPNFLPWLVPVGPLLAFLIITFATNRARLIPATSHEYGGHHPDYGGMLVPVVTPLSRVLSVTVGISGVVMALLISLNIVGQALGVRHFGEEVVFASSVEWMATGTTAFRMGVMIDPLNALLLVMVPIAVLCIFVYSIGYMAHDPRQSRFFALISLFAGAMLTLTVADNLLLLFVGWEVMGLCSYMLIGFWFEKHSAYRAAIKAFTVTRVADVVMLLGIAYLYTMTGTLNFRDIMQDAALLNAINTAPAVLFGSLGISAGGLIGTFLIIGTIGKSAQFPLHVWLPDAMEGPTPVSAMIHAAAMVSAGIYAVLRMFPLFVGAGDPVGGVANPHIGVYNLPLVLLAVVGAFTALFAATMAVAQNDIKGVLAYSTISQLGFMMAALGIGAYVAAAFHLITHAFFKALLFMASGSVIHAMEHGEHHVHAHGHDHEPEPAPATRPYYELEAAAADTHIAHDAHAAHDPHDAHGHHEAPEHGHKFDPQDMRNMGGLAKKIPVTFVGFVIGGLALAGFPLITSGFWSKDEILAEAWYGTLKGYGPQALVFFLLAIAAFLTAFYTMRQICLTFLGEPRTEEAKHASLGGPRSVVSITMQAPLIVLSFFALFAGFVGVPEYFPIFGPIFSPEGNPLFHFLEFSVLPEPNFAPFHPPFNPFPVLVSFAVALGGLYVGWRMYGRKPLQAGEVDPMERILGSAVYTTLQKRYYFDDLYGLLFVRPSQWLARQVNTFLDRGVIDGTLHAIGAFFTRLGDLIKMLNSWLIDGVGDGIPRMIYVAGGWLRGTQSGRIQQYLLAVLIAFLIIGIILAVSGGVVTAG